MNDENRPNSLIQELSSRHWGNMIPKSKKIKGRTIATSSLFNTFDDNVLNES